VARLARLAPLLVVPTTAAVEEGPAHTRAETQQLAARAPTKPGRRSDLIRKLVTQREPLDIRSKSPMWSVLRRSSPSVLGVSPNTVDAPRVAS